MPKSIDGAIMLSLSGAPRFFIYQKPINMQKIFEGLSQAIEEAFPNELLSGAYFIFLNRRRNLMKILHWDLDGFVIWYKRLEKGSFPRRSSGNISITRREFFMLLEGVTPKRLSPRFSLT